MIVVHELQIPTGLSATSVNYTRMLPEIAEMVKNEITKLAQRDLGASSQEYVSNLQLIHFPVTPTLMKRGPFKFASITLSGMLPNMLESGWPGGDLKPGLLAGRNAKDGESGRYNTVAFRHGTPGSAGRAGAQMGSLEAKKGMSRQQAELLGKNIHREAQKLTATITHTKAGRNWGRKLASRVTARLGAPKHLSHTGYEHKSDVYAGMVKVQKTYAKATQTKYITFRRVSENSDAGAWIHPGFDRHDFFGKAARMIPGFVKMMTYHVTRGGNRGFSGGADATGDKRSESD